jgi:MtrB/PioB family decaheme-associated outer membrane protein
MHLTSAVVLALLMTLTGASDQSTQSTPAQTGSGQKPGGQAPTPAAQPPADAQPAAGDAEEENTGWVGFVDVGVRGTNVNGDPSRFERYRDMSDGLTMEDVRLFREARGFLFDLTAEHVGRSDQRYIGSAVDPGRFRGEFMWDQIPMTLSTMTQTLYTGLETSTLEIDNAIQGAAQLAPSSINTLFTQNARTFETKTRRFIGNGFAEYEATEALTLRANYRHTNRSGTIPFGGSFGHSSLAELPAPTEHNLSDFNADAEYATDYYLLRGGYMGSWFSNDVTALIFDNPYRLTDSSSISGRGRLTLPPNHSFVGVNGMASVKLPYKSRATAYASVASLKDAGDPMVPQTINSANSTAPVERSTVEGEARTHSLNLSFVSRPNRLTDFTVRYRTYEYDNRTPQMTLAQRVSYDNTPSTLNPPIHTEPFGLNRGTLDADFRLTPGGRMSAGAGYSYIDEDRTYRIYNSTSEHIFRLVFDAMTRQWFSLRTKYEHTRKTGDGLEQGLELLAAAGEQPGMRHFDVAERDRDRFTVIGTFTPTSYLSTSLSFAAGADDFFSSEFGVRDLSHQIFGLGMDYFRNDNVTFGLSYSFEEYKTLQRSRQANPGVEFSDPARNWAADSSDKTHSVLLNADIARLTDKIGLRLSYDFSRGRGNYDYITGPVADRTLPEEILVPSTLPPPVELPRTLSEFHRATADISYALTSRVSLVGTYWYDQYRVEDFTLDIEANPSLIRGQVLLMGYLYRPYTANTAWLRLLYRF